MQKNKLGCSETAMCFEVRHHHRIQAWELIYLEERAEGFYQERRGHGSKGRTTKLAKQAEEYLIAEAQRLEAENGYLKKLNAMVFERTQREEKQKQ